MTVPSAARRRPAGRYDEPPRVAQRALAVLLGALFLGLLGAIAYALYVRLETPVRARVVGYEVVSDRQVRIDLEVSKDEGTPAYCVIRSRGADGAEVGRRVVTVDATGDAGRVVREVYELTTSARAVTGEAGRCGTEPAPAPTTAP